MICNQPNRQPVENLYEKAFGYVNGAFQSVREQQMFEVKPALPILREMSAQLMADEGLFIKAIHDDRLSDFLICHSVNVAVYAIKMAQNLGWTEEEQIEIGLTGLLHDIGIALIPKMILYKSDKLSSGELKMIREHSHYGFEILKAFVESYPFLPDAVLQIHERIDGSGYPNGLKGDEILNYAQLIGLVDTYESLIHSRPYRKKYLFLAAAKEIIATSKKNFHRTFLKTFLNVFSMFPIGSYVQLNSNAVGQVVQTYPDQPMRPKVQLIYDSQKRRIQGEQIINLPDNSLLYITDSITL